MVCYLFGAKNNFCGALWRIVGKIVYFCSLLHIIDRGMRFLGNIEAKIDAKGRVFLPSSFRKTLQAEGGDTLVMRKDVHESCLVLYPMATWEARMDSLLERVSPWDDEGRAVLRQYVSDAEVVSLDGNGRFLIPRRYLQLAEISQGVRFIGMNDTIEIWALEKTSAPFMAEDEFSARLKALMLPR